MFVLINYKFAPNNKGYICVVDAYLLLDMTIAACITKIVEYIEIHPAPHQSSQYPLGKTRCYENKNPKLCIIKFNLTSPII